MFHTDGSLVLLYFTFVNKYATEALRKYWESQIRYVCLIRVDQGICNFLL